MPTPFITHPSIMKRKVTPGLIHILQTHNCDATNPTKGQIPRYKPSVALVLPCREHQLGGVNKYNKYPLV